MKKLLLLLILSFFSAQGYAGSCPDGSEPVRSISADGTYFVFNCGGDNNNAKDTKESEAESPSSKSIYVSDKIYNDFMKLPKENKIQSCGFDGYSPNWQVINKDLAPRIKGFNSRMDNNSSVEGIHSFDVQVNYLQAITYGMVSEDIEVKEKLFDKLYDWASEDALSATMQCYSANGPKGLLSVCEGAWSDPEGQDMAPVKDATHMLEIVMSLNYVYKLYFADYQQDDKRHKVITEWFESFYHRIKPAKDFYFGNYVGWYLPNISIQHSQHKSYKSMVKNMVKGLDEWTFSDGSMKNLTTRGDHALWYHHRGIGEAFIIMEVARTANVEVPATFEKKLLKAVELFNDAYLDHSVIEPWAKKAHNSQASNGYQKDMPTLDWVANLSAWFQIFQLRYPEHRTSKWLNQELTSKSRSVKVAENTGITLGCIHKALADSSSEGLANQEAKQIKAASELSIFEIDGKTLNLTLDKIDFIETGPFKLKRKAEHLQPYQLHKASIKGSLNTRGDNNKKFDFTTLVYKYAGKQELVIHVDDPTVEPLKRHSDSLQKKCGTKVMEWGWLSFSIQTNDIESARSQQCIHDYFKEANDKESFELFQAILSGTDSILDYLETNVEP